MRSLLRVLPGVALVLVLVVVSAAAAGVKARSQRDKKFDFTTVRTFAWHPEGAGEVKILALTGDDPKLLQAQLDPVIRDAVERSLGDRGLSPAPAGTADAHVYYYLLVGANTSSQELGQFIGNAAEWGLPPITGSTTSLKIYEQGSLVLDVVARQSDKVVWRGIAQAEIDRGRTQDARADRVREGVRQMVKDYPRLK
jgi:hypothetical protein